jgi:formylglycine-generating enzyme required for sulfatase activity
MLNIFISYNRESEAIVRTLADVIKALGHKVWFDQELSGGQIWWDRILEEIRNCDVFVFALSPKALNSAACMRESDYAVALCKPILPVLIAEGVHTNLLPPTLSEIHIIDYRKQDHDAAIHLARAFSAFTSLDPLRDPLPLPPEAPISHLGKLAEQIETKATLSYEKQSALLVDLKRSLKDPKITKDARRLLEKLRRRGDLFAKIADEIAISGTKAQIPSERQRRRPRLARGIFSVLLFAVLIYVGLWSHNHYQNQKFGGMINIPAGGFLYGPENIDRIIDYDFSIDIYPVTNSQFEKFIEGAGYSNDNYWSEEGIKWRQDSGIISPEFWTDEKWNKPEHPVVGVSYYEAEAYAKWAGKRLPTEIEWERAARGTDARKFPWGNEFDSEKCNTEESGIGKTTPVTKYPKGISPTDCHDMAGNVWEWTISFYHEAEGILSVRGGSWNDTWDDAQCTSRIGYFANYRSVTLGFRCVRID